MKKTFLILLCTLSLFAADGEKKSFDTQPPSIKAPCTGGNDSFAVYKDTVCRGSGLDLLTPRCIELILMSALGLVSNDEVKHYKGEEAIAYLKEKRGK